MMKEKLLSLFALMSLGLSPLALADNKLCPIMIEDETDEEEVVEFEGKKVLFCCGTCVKLWNQTPKYYIKVMGELLPQFKGMEKELGLDEVKVTEALEKVEAGVTMPRRASGEGENCASSNLDPPAG